MRRECRDGEAGRTIAEMLVAMAILAMVISLVTSMQISVYRGSAEDQALGNVMRPVRDAVDHIHKDVEIAFRVSTPSDAAVTGGKYLELGQLINGQKKVVFFWLQGTELIRAEQSVAEWGDGDRATATPRTVVYGLSPVSGSLPFARVGSGTVRVILQATSTESRSTETREVQVDLTSRKEVGKCTAANPC
ncbi:MAG: PilW family protein [Bacillota bacterium]